VDLIPARRRILHDLDDSIDRIRFADWDALTQGEAVGCNQEKNSTVQPGPEE
jgi:hypothetical protein